MAAKTMLSLGPILKSGILYKQGGGHRDGGATSAFKSLAGVGTTFKKRFFEFDGRYLVYYESHEKATDVRERSGEYDLSVGFEAAFGDDAKSKQKFSLDVKTSAGQVYCVAAETKQDQIDWYSVLQSSPYSKASQAKASTAAPLPSTLATSTAPVGHVTKPTRVPSSNSLTPEDDGDDGDSDTSIHLSPDDLKHAIQNATLKGNLKKTAKNLWRRRAFVLFNSQLIYMRNLEDIRAVGVIDLTKAKDVRKAEAEAGQLNSFAIVLPNHTYLCCADSSLVRDEWVAAIRQIIDNPPPTATSPSLSSLPKSPSESLSFADMHRNVSPSSVLSSGSTISPSGSKSNSLKIKKSSAGGTRSPGSPNGSSIHEDDDVESRARNMLKKQSRSSGALIKSPSGELSSQQHASEGENAYDDDDEDDDDTFYDDDDDEVFDDEEDAAPAKLPSPVSSATKQPTAAVDATTTLFRLTSFASKVLKKYADLVGSSYLHTIFFEPLAQLCRDPSNLELDPTRAPDADFALNQKRLNNICQSFFSAIVNNRESMPPQLVLVGRLIHSQVFRVYPQAAGQAVGAILFLRFFVLAIAQPGSGGLFKESEFNVKFDEDKLKRTLIIIAKILQNLANGVEFGAKEQFMIPLNQFIKANMPSIAAYYETFSNKNNPSDISSLDSSFMPSAQLNAQTALLADKLRMAFELDKTLASRLGPQLASETQSVLTRPATEISEALQDLIVGDTTMGVATAICSVANVLDVDRVAEGFVSIFGRRKVIVPLLKWVVDDEVANKGAATSKKFDTSAVKPAFSDKRVSNLQISSTAVIRSGYLLKVGGKVKTWKKRWFVLTEGSLSYYRDNEQVTPLHVVDMIICSGVKRDDSKKPDSAAFVFQLITTERTFEIAAETSGERSDWVSDLQKVIEKSQKRRQRNTSSLAPATNETSASDHTKANGGVNIVHSRATVNQLMFHVHKEGFLLRKETTVRRRWVRLKDGIIAFYSDETEMNNLFIIEMEHCSRVASAEARLNIANAFEIVTAGRTHYLIAESEIEMQEWIDVLSHVVQYFRPSIVTEATFGQAIVMEGWLNKEGNANRALKNRYFVLRGTTLTYFKTQDVSNIQYKAQGDMSLMGAKLALDNTYHFCFTVSIVDNKERTFKLVAKNRQLMEAWYSSIQAVINKCTSSAPVANSNAATYLQKTKNVIYTTFNSVTFSKPTQHVPAKELLQSSLMNGWLMKTSRGQSDRALNVGKWQERYFVLHNHCLYYYKTQSDLEATGIIELHNVKTEPFVESTEAVGLLSKIKPETFAAPGYADALKDKSGFVITTDKKKYFMMPQHSAIVTNWLDSIKRSEKDWMDQAMKRTGLQHERLSDARTAKAVAQMMRANPTTPTTSSSSAAPAASASATSQSTSSVSSTSSTSSSINNNVPNIFAAADVDAFSELLKDLDAWCENMPDDDEDSDTEA